MARTKGPTPAKGVTSVRLTAEDRRELDAYIIVTGENQSDVIARALREFLEHVPAEVKERMQIALSVMAKDKNEDA